MDIKVSGFGGQGMARHPGGFLPLILLEHLPELLLIAPGPTPITREGCGKEVLVRGQRAPNQNDLVLNGPRFHAVEYRIRERDA